MDALACGHGHIERDAAFKLMSKILDRSPDIVTNDALRECFCMGSAAAADTAAEVLATCENHEFIQRLSEGLKPVIHVAPDSNLRAVALLAIEFAKKCGRGELALAMIESSYPAATEMLRAFSKALYQAAEVSRKQVQKLLKAVNEFLEAALIGDSDSMKAISAETRGLLFRVCEQDAMQLMLSVMSKLGPQAQHDLPTLVREMCRVVPDTSLRGVFMHAVDLSISFGESATCVALLEAVDLTALTAQVGAANSLFCLSSVVLQAGLKGELDDATRIVKFCTAILEDNLFLPELVTSSYAHAVAMCLSSSAGVRGHRIREARIAEFAAKASAKATSMDARVGSSESESLEGLFETIKSFCFDGSVLSVCLQLLTTARGKLASGALEARQWLRNFKAKLPQTKSSALLFADVVGTFLCGLLCFSPEISFEICDALPQLEMTSRLHLIPSLLHGFAQAHEGLIALEILKCIRRIAEDNYSSEIVVRSLSNLCEFRSKRLSRSALSEAALLELANLAAEKPSFGLKAMVSQVERMLNDWERVTPTLAAAAVSGAHVVIRYRPSRGTLFVPLLQKSMQAGEEYETAVATSLRALRSLCDEGILDAVKTIRIVFRRFELSWETLEPYPIPVRVAFVHFLGAGARAGFSKKGLALSARMAEFLRELLVREDQPKLVLEAAGEALSVFEERLALDFLGKTEEADEDSELLAKNKHEVYRWTCQVVKIAAKLGVRNKVASLITHLARSEWQNRARGDWSEMKILKMASSSLMRSRQADNGGGIEQRFRASANALPDSVIKALVQTAALLFDDDSPARAACDALVEAEALVPGLPWGELFIESARKSASRKTLSSCARASFCLVDELQQPLVAFWMSSLTTIDDEVADVLAVAVLANGKVGLIGQLLEHYGRRKRFRELFRLIVNHGEIGEQSLVRLVQLSLDVEVKLDSTDIPGLVSVIGKISPNQIAQFVNSSIWKTSILVGLINEQAMTKHPLQSTAKPVLLQIQKCGDTEGERKVLEAVLQSLQELPLSSDEDLDHIGSEIHDFGQLNPEWSRTITTGIAVARAKLWSVCRSVDDLQHIVLSRSVPSSSFLR
ncbi:hypothetical protein NDN08_008156 [Rhodosorus marinus]|uniref:Uncharacterized protein n=1 Tax=Rhodosorus marinus TaxID=101924 RepID=A0AAV8UZN6_9RHOD|nr:hypothetical protein NDN08_008156 [Rhodosorus marinus]